MRLRVNRQPQTGNSNFKDISTIPKSSTLTLTKESLKHSTRSMQPTGQKSTAIVGEAREKGNREGTMDIIGMYKDDIQNTKIVHFDNSRSAESQERMKDIKQLIQRRYANRKNIFNIFSEWDQEHRGEISADNAKNIMNCMGMNINSQEATQFVKYVSSGRQAICLNDFLAMLYQPKPLAVFKKTNRSVEPRTEPLPYCRNKILALLSNYASKIVSEIESTTDHISQERFLNIIEGSRVPRVSQEQIVQLFNEYRGRSFLKKDEFMKDLKDYKLVVARSDEDPPKKLDSKAKALIGYKYLFGQKENMQQLAKEDVRKMNATKLEQTLIMAERFKSRLRRYLPSKDKFQQVFTGMPGQTRTTYDSLKSWMLSLMKGVSEPVGKKEIQGFMNMFIYNDQGQTKTEDIAKVIYEETNINCHERLDNFPRCLPPAESTNHLQSDSVSQDSKNRIVQYLGGFPTDSYKLFKRIDHDNDGYLSQSQFANKLRQRQFTDEECTALFSQSANSKQYMTYDQFAKFLQIDVPACEQYPNMRPKRQFTQAKDYSRVDPRQVTYNQGKTRFSGTPPHSLSCLFSPVKQCLSSSSGTLNASVEFQQEEKLKKQSMSKSRLLSIQQYREAQQLRIQECRERQESRDRNNMQKKADLTWAYNHVNNLKNIWK